MTTNAVIAIVGASGFVGAHLYERLRARGHERVVPIIHSSGNAWRIVRWGATVRSASLLDRTQMAEAIRGCSHVVNCSRGDDSVMLQGLRNLLEVCVDERIRGFVHLSSVMVYGDPPSHDSNSESGTIPGDLTGYPRTKLEQDRMVQSAATSLPSVILCPPNITGPYSPFLVNLASTIRSGRFALLEDGSAPCVVVDVDNLAFAIERALDAGTSQPRRLFITDPPQVTWRMITEPLARLAEVSRMRRISRDELIAMRERAKARPPASLARSFKHLVSSDVRRALREDPLLARLDTALRNSVARLGSSVENKLRLAIEGQPPVPRLPSGPAMNVTLSAQQLRGIWHSCAAARERIGYEPPRTFAQSMSAFERWYNAHMGMDDQYWPLLSHLWPRS